MVSENMAVMIKENADELTKRLCKDLLSREETRSYRNLNQDIVYERAYDVYNKLDSWLQREKGKAAEIKKYFTKLGERRYHEGIPLNEEIMTLMLIKRHLWLFVLEKHFFDSSFELQQALQFNNQVVLFFDRIIYHVSNGYEQEQGKAAGKKQ
jgi:hypothetical protein